MLNADKEANALKEAALHQGFLKATCEGKILLRTEFTPVPAIPGLPWNCGALLMLTTMDFNSQRCSRLSSGAVIDSPRDLQM